MFRTSYRVLFATAVGMVHVHAVQSLLVLCNHLNVL